MSLFFPHSKKRLHTVGLMLALAIHTCASSEELNVTDAEELVKNQPCSGSDTIEQALEDKIKTSQRDLGWRVFDENERIEVERAFLMNKSMRLKFRWRINENGSVVPVSEQAQQLCGRSIPKLDVSTAENIVRNTPCVAGSTIDETIKKKINLRSQRDLGWHVFTEQGQYDVERAFLMNKSMRLRYRWRVNPDGSIEPVSGRAESLCGKEE